MLLASLANAQNLARAPTKEIMLAIADLPWRSKSPNVLPFKMNFVGGIYLYHSKINFRGIQGSCSFCCFTRKATISEWRVCLTKELKGSTHCSPSTMVLQEISEFFVTVEHRIQECSFEQNLVGEQSLLIHFNQLSVTNHCHQCQWPIIIARDSNSQGYEP